MSVTADVLTRRAAVEREKLTAAFDALEEELKAVVDWREYVRHEPVLTLGVAALGGAILGAASAPRRRSARLGNRSTLREASEAVVGSTASSTLLRRAGEFVLELVVARALAAYRRDDRPAPATAEPTHATQRGDTALRRR